MQKGSFTKKNPRFNAEGVVTRINVLSARFRRIGCPVIFIQHDGGASGEFEKNTWEWELLDGLQVSKSDLKVDKYANDSFYKSNFEGLLVKMGVNELVVVGCATDFCVESTVQSALVKDFGVTIVADGHTA